MLRIKQTQTSKEELLLLKPAKQNPKPKVSEHLDFYLKTKCSVKDPDMSCDICTNTKCNVNLF